VNYDPADQEQSENPVGRADPQDPLVTVVIPTHNRPHLADRAIDSALAQSVGNIDVILVDDGSEPPFRSEREDPRLVIVRCETPKGVCAARNVGLAEARGKWITFLDDDDELRPEMVERALQAADQSSLPAPVAVLSAMALVDPEGLITRVRYPVTLPRGKHYFLEEHQPGSYQTHNSLIAPTNVFRAIGGWDELMRGSEHDDLFLRLNAACSIQGVAEATYRHWEHQGPRLHVHMRHRAEAMERTLRKHRGAFRQHPRKAAHYMATMGATYLRSGAWLAAIRWTSQALLTRPEARYLRWFAASLAGPRVLALVRWLRDRRRGPVA